MSERTTVEWFLSSEVLPPAETAVLAWDGQTWHKADYYPPRRVEAFLDDDYYDDVDEDGTVWMQEGWYVTTPISDGELDFHTQKLRNPVTRWAFAPERPAARDAKERKP